MPEFVELRPRWERAVGMLSGQHLALSPRKKVREIMSLQEHYEELVYAGVLGKVIGVYLGRPFEQWNKDKIVEKWGFVDRYVHQDQKVPLVVSDDDITGTFTFIRALEDSGLYADTPAEYFGEMWLNYIMENKTILWWGGLGLSTEHTAFLRLKQGHKAPHSGSIALNGKTVAEQIGAQIFIDAFGLVAPGNPQLAAKLAQRSAQVSHDGEAVHAALVVAAMVSGAFVEKDMNKLLDIGASVIPPDCLIAQLHRDVRQWAREDGCWHKTFNRIAQKWGYDRFGGGCHILPNHALMVLAWSYAPDNFRQALAICATAGWDTDCNVANVGSVLGVKLGLEGINKDYDFQGPTADRIILPTAEGTRSISDCATEALHVARIGRKIMGWPELPAPKEGAKFHFTLPGSRHGFEVQPNAVHETPGPANVSNVVHKGSRALAIDFSDLADKRPAIVSTPTMCDPTMPGYGAIGTPQLYAGMTVTLHGEAVSVKGDCTARLFVAHFELNTRKPTGMCYGEPVKLSAGQPVMLQLAIPDTAGWPITKLGIEIVGPEGAAGRMVVECIVFGGQARVNIPHEIPRTEGWSGQVVGWVHDLNVLYSGHSAFDHEACINAGKNEGRGVCITGDTTWTDLTCSCRLANKMAEKFGLMVRYQGLRKYVAVIKTASSLQLVSCYDGQETVLSETPCIWAENEWHALVVTAKGREIAVTLDGKPILKGCADRLLCGGAGFLLENGVAYFRETDIRCA